MTLLWPLIEETIVFAVIESALNFLDDACNTVGVENWELSLKRYHDYCTEKGLALADITKF